MLIWSANSWILNSYAWPTKNNIHLPTHMTEEYGSDEYFMRQALAQAQMASERGEIPVGVVITGGGRIIARGHNMTGTLNELRQISGRMYALRNARTMPDVCRSHVLGAAAEARVRSIRSEKGLSLDGRFTAP